MGQLAMREEEKAAPLRRGEFQMPKPPEQEVRRSCLEARSRRPSQQPTSRLASFGEAEKTRRCSTAVRTVSRWASQAGPEMEGGQARAM
jgi:hypothetical protein